MNDWEKRLKKEIEQILLGESIYKKPGLSKKVSKEIEIIHKRDRLFDLFSQELKR